MQKPFAFTLALMTLPSLAAFAEADGYLGVWYRNGIEAGERYTPPG